MGDEPGRIWDTLHVDGSILVLELANDSEQYWYGNRPEHHYSLYVSDDQGRTFTRRSILPFEFQGRGYGALSLLPDGALIAYVYNIADEKHLDYALSRDGGHTWGTVGTAYMAKQIRNPQMAAFGEGFVLHGRSGSKGDDPAVPGHFVLYTSLDGTHWDEGRYLKMRQAGAGAYSNNLLVNSPGGDEAERLLIQASHAYEGSRTSIYHWWLQ